MHWLSANVTSAVCDAGWWWNCRYPSFGRWWKQPKEGKKGTCGTEVLYHHEMWGSYTSRRNLWLGHEFVDEAVSLTFAVWFFPETSHAKLADRCGIAGDCRACEKCSAGGWSHGSHAGKDFFTGNCWNRKKKRNKTKEPKRRTKRTKKRIQRSKKTAKTDVVSWDNVVSVELAVRSWGGRYVKQSETNNVWFIQKRRNESVTRALNNYRD